MAWKLPDSTPPGRWLAGSAEYSDVLKPSRAPSAVPAIALKPLGSWHGNTRIANIRQNFLHRVSSHLAKTHSQLAIEDLATANLIRNKHLSRAIADAGWGEFADQLTYKADWFGGELVTCDRWFASTKICSACGTTKKKLALAERTFRCSSCGLMVDRDSNAAANLAAWADAAVLAPAQAPDRQAGGRVTKASGGGQEPPARRRRI